jgi:hypothetical protein
MKSQIRAPKARKVNSYMVKSSNEDYSSHYQQMVISDFPKLEKRNSDNNIHNNLLNFDDEDHICLESIESEFREQVNKLSVISEIKQIVSQPTSIELRTSIERCENPFSKNFPEHENENNQINSIIAENKTDYDLNKEESISYNHEKEANIKECDPEKSDMRVNTFQSSTAEKSDYSKIVKGINENILDARNDFCHEKEGKRNTYNRNLKNEFDTVKQAEKEKDNSKPLNYRLNNQIENEPDSLSKTSYNNYNSKINEDNDMSFFELNDSKNSSLIYTTSFIDISTKKGISFETTNHQKAKLYENLINRKRFRAKASTLNRPPSKNVKRANKKSLSRKVSTKESPRNENKLNNTILACIFSPSFYEYKVDAFATNRRMRCAVTSMVNTENEALNSYLQLAH